MPRAKPFIFRPVMLRATDTNCTTQAAKKWLADVDALLKDARNPDRLKDILSRYRIMYWRHDKCPSRDSVRETLKQLANQEKREKSKRWQELDEAEKKRILRASKWQNLDEAVKVEIRRATKKINCPDNLPEAAKMAHESMEHKQAGQKRIVESAVLFARDLARYWYETEGKKPTAYGWTDAKASPFQSWVEPLFKLTGFATGDLPKTLRAGIKEAQK